MKKSKVEVDKLKADILETALDVFLNKNYSEVNIKDISQRLGITRTPIYYHFNSKYDIYSQVVQEYLREKIKIFGEILLSDKDYFIKIKEDLSLCTRQMISENIIFGEITTNPELAEILRWRKETFDTIYGYKLEAVKLAIKNGRLRDDFDPCQMVDNLYLLHFGLMEMSQCGYHEFPMDTIKTLIELQIENLRHVYGKK